MFNGNLFGCKSVLPAGMVLSALHPKLVEAFQWAGSCHVRVTDQLPWHTFKSEDTRGFHPNLET